MSESLNWPAIGLWTALTSFQIGTAIRDICNKWRQRSLSRPSTDYERVINGERINGWKIAIPQASIERHIGVGPDPYNHGLVKPRWARNRGDLTIFSRYSQLLWFKRFSRMIDREVFHLNRFSLITPNAHAFIMRVSYDDWDWNFELAHYMTDRLLVVVFRNDYILHLTMLDVVTGSHRIAVIKSPIQNENSPKIVMVLLSDLRGRIDVLFGDRSWRNRETGELDYEITIASYDIANSGTIEAPIRATSSQSILIPIHVSNNVLWKSVSSDILVLHVYQEAADIENIPSFIFSEGTWRVDSLSSWLSSFRATSYGAKWMNAVEAFGALSPPSSVQGEIPPLRYARRISGFTIDGAVLCRPDGAGILERSMSPHSLKRLAAEAFCKANPRFNFAGLKSHIGFDVFDGIYDEKEPLMIHL